MTQVGRMKYFGWSAISIETDGGSLAFDPFYRPYCGASWFGLDDFRDVKYICVTHGHEEHFLDVPIVAKETGATVVAAPSVCSFLRRRRKIDPHQLVAVDPNRFESTAIPGLHGSRYGFSSAGDRGVYRHDRDGRSGHLGGLNRCGCVRSGGWRRTGLRSIGQ